MISIPVSKAKASNERKYGDNVGDACVVCSRPIAEPKYMVRIYAGCDICTDAEAEANPDADTGFYPIGTECIRKHPQIKPYVQEVTE